MSSYRRQLNVKRKCVMNQKVFLIGIDGGTFDIINPLVEKGDLPNILRFMREGIWGHLTSTLPPMIFPA